MLNVATMPELSAQGVAVGVAVGGAAVSGRNGVRVGSGNGAAAAAAVVNGGVSSARVTVGAGVSDRLGVTVGGRVAVPVSALAAWTTPGVVTNDNDWGVQAARLAHSAQHNKMYSGRMLIGVELVASGRSSS